MTPMKQVTILESVGAVLVIVFGILLGVFPLIYNSIVDKVLVLSESSATLDAFIEPPVPIYMQFWLFDVVNPDEVRYYGKKPIVREVGPYTYTEKREKYNITWDHTDGTVNYRNLKSYFFNQEMSKDLSESDNITMINSVMAILGDLFASAPDSNYTLVLNTIWAELEKELDLFETHTVSDILFEGIPLPEFDFDFSDVGIGITEGLSGTIYEILQKLGLDAPEALKPNRFGFFFGLNATDDGVYKVKTGEKGIGNYLNIQEWKGEPSLSYWEDDYCDMINGTDGSQFPPRPTSDTTLYLYVSQLCRSIYLTYEKDIDHFGIKALRFTPPEEVLQVPPKNPDNQCFCIPSCEGDGLLNLRPCLGIPVILSTPHFYQGDETLPTKIDGIIPIKEEHETVIDVEPRTGVPMHAAQKIQFNVPLKPYDNLPSFMTVPDVIFPLFWINESATVDVHDSEEMKKAVQLPFVIVNAVCGSLIAIGVVLIIVGLIRYFNFKRSRSMKY